MEAPDDNDKIRKKEIADQIFQWARYGRSSEDKFCFSDAKEKYQIIHENVLKAAFELLVEDERLIKSGKSRNPYYSVSERYLYVEVSENDDDDEAEEENVVVILDEENAVNGTAVTNNKNEKKYKKKSKKKKSTSATTSASSSSPLGKVAKIDQTKDDYDSHNYNSNNNNDDDDFNDNNNETPQESFDFTSSIVKEEPVVPIFKGEALSEDQIGKIGQYCFEIIADGGGQAELETLRQSIFNMKDVNCSSEQFDSVIEYLDKKGDVMVHDSLVFDCH